MQANSISSKAAYCQCFVFSVVPCSGNKTLICLSVELEEACIAKLKNAHD